MPRRTQLTASPASAAARSHPPLSDPASCPIRRAASRDAAGPLEPPSPAGGASLFGDLETRRARRDLNAEARAQAAIVEYVRTVAPQVLIFHVPNGGLRSKTEAARLKWTGVMAGVFDLVLALPYGRCAFWETKTDRGRLSADQRAFQTQLIGLGHVQAVVRTIDDARRELSRYRVETREARAMERRA